MLFFLPPLPRCFFSCHLCQNVPAGVTAHTVIFCCSCFCSGLVAGGFSVGKPGRRRSPADREKGGVCPDGFLRPVHKFAKNVFGFPGPLFAMFFKLKMGFFGIFPVWKMFFWDFADPLELSRYRVNEILNRVKNERAKTAFFETAQYTNSPRKGGWPLPLRPEQTPSRNPDLGLHSRLNTVCSVACTWCFDVSSYPFTSEVGKGAICSQVCHPCHNCSKNVDLLYNVRMLPGVKTRVQVCAMLHTIARLHALCHHVHFVRKCGDHQMTITPESPFQPNKTHKPQGKPAPCNWRP